ncbi:MAG: hypothetical protein ACOY4H_00695 [Thermodesulfobacteriota bacterium]
MNEKILNDFKKLQRKLIVQQEYIKKLEILLRDQEQSCQEALAEVKRQYSKLLAESPA